MGVTTSFLVREEKMLGEVTPMSIPSHLPMYLFMRINRFPKKDWELG
jgi:hypothetical protein